ncbi:hypothetical protein GCM10027022_10880 [Alpinimonas psychrophila]|uniref:Uncharacterized protein n=1 Tax=Alpinimonas psychrophila TaxID=748908 RepID=A0A7W3JTE8_9MICO|nr:hypothetical protein [Alpinimonas psychrophila]
MTTDEFEECGNLLADERTTQYELLKEELSRYPGVIATRARRHKPDALLAVNRTPPPGTSALALSGGPQ